MQKFDRTRAYEASSQIAAKKGLCHLRVASDLLRKEIVMIELVE